MADTELQNKLNAALRYGATTAGTVMTIAAVMSVLKPEQVVDLKAQIEVLNGSILTAYGALTKMWLILGPVAIFWMGKVGWDSSTVKSLAGKLLNIASNGSDAKGSVDAKVAIVTAAASRDIGTTAIINPDLAANPATPSNVIAHPEYAPKT